MAEKRQAKYKQKRRRSAKKPPKQNGIHKRKLRKHDDENPGARLSNKDWMGTL